MSLTLGVVMDPIESITPYKDTTLAMMLAAQARGWTVHSIDQKDMYLDQGRAFSRRRKVTVYDDNQHWFDAEDPVDAPMSEHDIILMRKDPPFDMDFIYTTYILERAAVEGVYVSNRPNSLRDVNEKLYTSWFSEFCPPTLVTTSSERLKAFITHHGDAIIKPLDGMGGAGIFRLRPDDPNINIILEHSTLNDTRQIMAQRYVPEIKDGDKRVLVVNGKAVPYALARIPAQGETRGNLAAGGRGVPVAIGDKERRIVDAVAPYLLERGLLFVGLDVIGSYLTEVNVTSPTCVRELDAFMHKEASIDVASTNGYVPGIADTYLDAVEAAMNHS
ncbi:glutathione synthase [Granulosicoccus antarcticus]|uniref:Glutathione synthetase n=1 Tax=Granulosicoccus antarcticus IMCC3135 TaxID=1192854 RepID=A0A2Z2NRF8_9GAMM|nr:glutathione synthase [Granulosicoccus antarcticus]ASJ71330.1 Glutathione synthetase [Granulosicoccus antarcticus IMCC3135]